MRPIRAIRAVRAIGSARARRLLAGSIAASLLGSMLAFAPAPSALGVSDRTPDVPDVRVEVGTDGTVHRTVSGRSDRFGFAPGDDLGTPTAWRDRVRRTVEARGLTTASAMDDCGAECEEPSGSHVWTTVEPTGDLDGDGTDDVLVLAVTYDEEAWTSSTVARSGADGHELWASQDGGMGFVATVPDVDGDGLVDLASVLWTQGLWHGGSCTFGLSCSFAATWTDSVSLTVVRGATGEVVGGHTVTSTYEFEYEEAATETPTGWAGTDEYRVAVEDGFFGFLFVDLDGDGTHQLVHESFDATFSERFVGTINDTPLGWGDAVAWRSAEDLSGEVVVADLVTGASEPLVTLTDAVPWAWVVTRAGSDGLLVDALPELGEVYAGCVFIAPAGGDCGDDRALPTSGANDATPTRTLYDADFEPVWEVPMPDWSFVVYGAGTDLDGDGVEDLFDLRIDEDGESYEDIVVAVDGATGKELWTAEATVVAAEGEALVGGRIRYDDQIRVDGLVVDPTTGSVLAERELVAMAVPEENPDDTWLVAGAWLDVLPLAGGDNDVLAEAYAAEYEIEEVCETWEEPDGTTVEWCYGMLGDRISQEAQLRGADGHDLHDLVALDDPSFWLLQVADLDGGDAELVGRQVGEAQAVDRALRLDGTALWALPAPQFTTGLLGTPDGTSDVLVVDPEASTLGVQDGADLGARWEVVLPAVPGGGGGSLVVH